MQVIAGWLPSGLISTDSIKHTIGRAVPEGWVGHPNFWAVACDYESGKRVAFGRDDAPPAKLRDAVAASCAIPSFFRPVEIDGRRYVDGGVCSASNLDLVAGAGLDLVICMNPTSTRERLSASNPLERAYNYTREASGRRLGYEARKVRATGTRVVLLQPTVDDLKVMGRNLMSTRRRHEVLETAIETVREQLRDRRVRDRLEGLPKGDPHKIRRPPGPPSTWPELVPAIRRGRAAA
jgi:NTE family protein